MSDEDVHKAFQEFMLGEARPTLSPAVSTPQHVKSLTSSQLGKALRKYDQIIGAFEGTLRRDWLDIDDNLEMVVHSIATLRERCLWASKMLVLDFQQDRSQPWHGSGYREHGRQSSFLSQSDIELALSSDLLQHEKMIAGVRKLLAAMQQGQEALGRRLDELMLLHLDCAVLFVETEGHSYGNIIDRVERCEQLFGSLATELYRKQVLAEEIFESVNNALLFDGAQKYVANESPCHIANRLASKWSRKHPESHLYELRNVLSEISKDT